VEEWRGAEEEQEEEEELVDMFECEFDCMFEHEALHVVEAHELVCPRRPPRRWEEPAEAAGGGGGSAGGSAGGGGVRAVGVATGAAEATQTPRRALVPWVAVAGSGAGGEKAGGRFGDAMPPPPPPMRAVAAAPSMPAPTGASAAAVGGSAAHAGASGGANGKRVAAICAVRRPLMPNGAV